MAKRPYVKFYVDDFFGSFKTQRMTTEQIGAYFLMLMASSQEDNIDLLDDDELLGSITRLGKKFKNNSKVLKSCFKSDDGKIYSDKLRKVLKEYDTYVENQRIKSLKGVEARKPTGNPRVNYSEPTGNPTITITNNHNQEPIIKEINKEKVAAFTKPTWNEVGNFIFKHLLEKDINPDKLKVQAEANSFVDYYESKGWLVGKSPMRNWQAAARRWVIDKDVKAEVVQQRKFLGED
jgi:uncharacterized protein YdaU (DUF1376 family)